MNPEPRLSNDGSDNVEFDAENGDETIRIYVPFEPIEDYLRRESMTPEERLAFVTRNRQIIAHNVAQYIRPDPKGLTAIYVTEDLLRDCVTP